MNKVFYIVFVLVIIISCTNKNRRLSDITSDAVNHINMINKDTIQSIYTDFALDGVVNITMEHDTLKIAATSKFPAYPFGEYETITEFSNAVKSFFNLASEELAYPYNDSIVNYIWRYSRGKSYIKALDNSTFNEEELIDVYIELVSGKIYDENIVLVNGIKLGMSKKQILNLFLGNASMDYITNDINVIELISAFLSFRHYYIFEEDQLKTIFFDSDYIYDKD